MDVDENHTIGCMNKNIGKKTAIFPGLNSCLGIRGNKTAAHLTAGLLCEDNFDRLEEIIDTLIRNNEKSIKIICKDELADIKGWLDDLKLESVQKAIPKAKLKYLSTLIKEGKTKKATDGFGML